MANSAAASSIPLSSRSPASDISKWNEEKLEPWKEVVHRVMHHHATDPASRIGQISTEFIPTTDYGAGARYSVFQQAVACAKWMHET